MCSDQIALEPQRTVKAMRVSLVAEGWYDVVTKRWVRGMRFAWDEAKNRRNLRKHKISFESARLVFDDPQALSERERQVGDEERW